MGFSGRGPSSGVGWNPCLTVIPYEIVGFEMRRINEEIRGTNNESMSIEGRGAKKGGSRESHGWFPGKPGG